MREAIAKPHLPVAFLGQTEERDTQFSLLVLIKDDKCVGQENLMALKVIRLYFKKMWYVIGSQCSFEERD